MSDLLNKLDLLILLFLYTYFIYLGIRYFNKSTIEEIHLFNTIKYLGIGLIVVILYLGFVSEGKKLIISTFNLIISLTSFYLLYSATSQHRQDPLNFAFSKSNPKAITTHGVYKYIRHPIYTGYILGWIAGLLKTQNVLIVPPILIMTLVYIKAIIKEENEFMNSPVSEEYKKYKISTKKLIPYIY